MCEQLADDVHAGTRREKGAVEGAVRYHKTAFWPARRFGSPAGRDELYVVWRDRVALPRRHATACTRARGTGNGRATAQTAPFR